MLTQVVIRLGVFLAFHIQCPGKLLAIIFPTTASGNYKSFGAMVEAEGFFVADIF